MNDRPEDADPRHDTRGRSWDRERAHHPGLVCPFPGCGRDDFASEPSRQRHLNARHGGVKFDPGTTIPLWRRIRARLTRSNP